MPANQWVRGANGSLFMLDESVSAPCALSPTKRSEQPSSQRGSGRNAIWSLQAQLDELDALMRTSRVDNNEMGLLRSNALAPSANR